MTDYYQKKYFVYASIGFLLLIFSACRSARFLEEDQSLVVRTEIEGLSSTLKEEAEDYIPAGVRPNSRVNLFLYHLVNTSSGKYKSQNIRKIGEAPHILDSALVDLAALQVNRFLFNKGFLDAQVNNQITYKGRKAAVLFQVDTGRPYTIDRILLDIPDPSVATLYLQNKSYFSSLRPGIQLDIDSIAAEREGLYTFLKNQGYYDFTRQHMHVDLDTTIGNHRVDLQIHIDNDPGRDWHIKYQMDSSFVRILHADPSRNLSEPKVSLQDGGLIFQDYTGSFRPRALARHLFHQQDDLYSLQLENMTYDRLYELNSFRSVKINYQKIDSNRLQAHYELIPRARMSNQIEGEYTFSGGMSGFNLANTFSHRNLFGGSEQLDIKLSYGLLFDARMDGGLLDRVFNNDFQIGVNVTIPRLLTPFGIWGLGSYGLPRTTFSSTLQIFDQLLTYHNRYAVNTMTYHWWSSRFQQHQFSPLVLEYRRGQLNSSFADQLIDQGYLLYVRSNNRAYFGLGSQHVYTYNAPKLNRLEDFFYMRTALDFSGNLLHLASELVQFKENADGEKELFGAPYLQYAKLEGDFRFYKHFGGNRQLIFRFNPGIAIPYGNNSSMLIFEKSFYGGGMNGMRAWQARTLGPGNYNRKDLDPALRMNLRNLDQLGEIKLETNLEYRFKILQNLWGAQVNGAAFADMGNIWQLEEQQLTPGGRFQADRFLGQIAIGAGAGLRFDLEYFVLRLDVGAKVKDPQFSGDDQWVISKWFDGKSFKDRYATTNAPDRYRFVQYNFGIGMPF